MRNEQAACLLACRLLAAARADLNFRRQQAGSRIHARTHARTDRQASTHARSLGTDAHVQRDACRRLLPNDCDQLAMLARVH